MVARYLPEPLRGIDDPEPMTRGARRELAPRYIDRDPDGPVPKRTPATTLPAYAVGLPAYRGWPVDPPRPTATGLYQPIDVTPNPNPTLLADTLRDFFARLKPAFAQAGKEIQAMMQSFVDAGLLPGADDGPTDDPMARALWLRQHRNTGPSRDVVHQHRPRTSHHHGARR